MSKDIRPTRQLGPHLAYWKSSCSLRYQGSSFRFLYSNYNPGRDGGLEIEPIIILLDYEALPPPLTSREQQPPSVIIPHFDSSLQLCEYISQIVSKEVARERAKQLHHAT